MNLFIRKATMLVIVLMGVALINYPVMATDVGGPILTNTTWYYAGSPYNITSTVQIKEGVTLTIEPGVVVNGAGHEFELEVFGTLNAIGEENSKISFNDLTLGTGMNMAFVNGVVNMAFAEFSARAILIGGYGGILNLSDSTIRDLTQINLHATSGDCYIERNVFINARGIHAGSNQNYDLYIRNNVFYLQNGTYAISDAGNSGQTIVQYNSFLSTDRVALKLFPPGISTPADMVASYNFWNTDDTDIIESMIWDAKDDLNIVNVIDYIPILETPHEDTPILDLNQAPTSNCGDDQVVHDEVTLDGSASYDPDGTIAIYEWSLQHEDGSTIPATGSNPTITSLPSGFYDVYLTVTDDGGLVGVDNMLLAAAGSCLCDASTMHIQSIATESIKGTKGSKFCQATVTVFDDCGNPVSGAIVAGTFDVGIGPPVPAISQTTNSNGIAVITSNDQFKKPSFEFCVTDVEDTLTYDDTANVENCDSN